MCGKAFRLAAFALWGGALPRQPHLTIRLARQDRDRLTNAARALGMSRSELVRLAIRRLTGTAEQGRDPRKDGEHGR